jgi:hypothetical protein
VSTVHIFPRDSERAAIFGLRGQWSSGSPGVYWLMEELSESLAHTASANSQRRTTNANVWEEHSALFLCSCARSHGYLPWAPIRVSTNANASPRH